MDNGGVGRFADGRCPGHRSSVHGKGDGKRGGGRGGEGPLEPGFIEPECSNICRGEESTGCTRNREQSTGYHSLGGPPSPDKGGQPFPPPPSPPYLRERLVPQTSRRKSRVLDVLANDAARCPLCLYRRICVSARVNIYV